MVTKRRSARLLRVAKNRQRGLCVVLEDIHDPHNAEAVFRACDAFGVQDVYLIFEKEKYFNAKKVGKVTSASANKWLDFHIFRSTKECIGELKRKGYRIFAAALASSSKSLFEKKDWPQKTAILIGNEHRGLSETALKYADEIVFIPMSGMVQSLNLSVTAGIFMFEVTRSRINSKKLKTLGLRQMDKLIKKWGKL